MRTIFPFFFINNTVQAEAPKSFHIVHTALAVFGFASNFVELAAGNTRGIQKVMHSKAMLVQDLTNLVCIWHKRDRTHLFAILICFSLIFRFLKLKLDLEMAAPLKARQKQNAKAKLRPLFSGILKV